MEIRHFVNKKICKDVYSEEQSGLLIGRSIVDEESELNFPFFSESMISDGVMSISIYDRQFEDGTFSEPINALPTIYFGDRITIEPAIRAFRGAAGSSRLYDALEAGYEHVCLSSNGTYFPMDKNGLTYPEYCNSAKEKRNKELDSMIAEGIIGGFGK